MMDFKTYMPLALRTAAPMPTSKDEFEHCLLGYITEIGEFTSEVKRIFAYKKTMTEDMRTHMCEELGDLCWYVPVGMRALGVTDIETLIRDLLNPFEIDIDSLKGIAFSLSLLQGSLVTYLIDRDKEDPWFYRQVFSATVYLIDCAAEMLGTTGDQLRADNIAKLTLRYPDKFSETAAEARADKGGADHRVS